MQQPLGSVTDVTDVTDLGGTDGPGDSTMAELPPPNSFPLSLSYNSVTSVTGVTDRVKSYLNRFMVVTDWQADAVALFVLHTYCIEAATYTPYLHVWSAERESGKSTLLDIMKNLVWNPMDTSYVSAAGLRRMFNEPRTLLWDEIDQVFARRSEDIAEVRQVLNAGFKRGEVVLINVPKGKNWQLEEFSVFSAKVFAGIGPLPDPLNSRCIPIRLQRKANEETRQRFQEGIEQGELIYLRSELSAKAKEILPQLPTIVVTAPDSLSGRQADIWSPLFAIATVLGGDWLARAQKAAVMLHMDSGVEESEGTMLLRDIREVLGDAESLFTEDLISGLLRIETSPWAQAGKRGAISSYELSKILKPYDIQPLQVRAHGIQKRGYYKVQFEDAWKRYLR